MFLQVFFSQVFEISLGESNVGIDRDPSVIVGHFDMITQFSKLAFDFNSLAKELGEAGSIENFILDGAGAVDSEVEVNWFLLLGLHGWNIFNKVWWKKRGSQVYFFKKFCQQIESSQHAWH